MDTASGPPSSVRGSRIEDDEVGAPRTSTVRPEAKISRFYTRVFQLVGSIGLL